MELKGAAEGTSIGIKGIRKGEMVNSDDEQGSHGHGPTEQEALKGQCCKRDKHTAEWPPLTQMFNSNACPGLVRKPIDLFTQVLKWLYEATEALAAFSTM
jgi:hypothetical protein